MAKKGYVIDPLTRPFATLRQPNYLYYARVISNPHVALHSPYNLDHPDGNYSLLERVILRNLSRESVPKLKPTGDRESHPRNAGFKRAKVQEKWWLKPFSVLQTNLREVDIDMDVDKVADSTSQLGPDAWLTGVGGIQAQYPTGLPFHTKNELIA
ncbi:hypothetical protein BJX64DRAFT_292110 [Aspergillus heterothallicus]